MTGFATHIIDLNMCRTDAGAELFNAGLKSFKVTFRGIDDVEFYILMVTKLYA